MSPIPSPPANMPHGALSLAMLGAGTLLVLASACAVLGFLLMPLFRASSQLATSASVLSLTAAALGYGIILLKLGRGLRRNDADAPLTLRSPLLYLAAFLLALGLGQVILTLNFQPAYLFPWWHVLASIGVPLVVLSFAVRRLPPVSTRALLTQFAWGGLVTIVLSLVFELVVGGILAGLALAGILVVLGSERATALMEALQSGLSDLPRAIEIVTREPLAILIVAVTAIVLFVAAVPFIEETLKATGPAIFIARRERAGRTPTRSEVVLWGLAAGAGYAFTENLFNTTSALGAGEPVTGFWAVGMLIRSGTTLMHMLATATVAVGWYRAIVNHKRMRLALLLAAAMTAHGMWNMGAIVFGSVASFGNSNSPFGFVQGLLVGMAMLALVVLFVVFLYWLLRLVRWAQPPPVEIIPPHNLTKLYPNQIREV